MIKSLGAERKIVLRQVIFQSAANDFSICCKRFFNLLQTIFQSAANDFSFGAD